MMWRSRKDHGNPFLWNSAELLRSCSSAPHGTIAHTAHTTGCGVLLSPMASEGFKKPRAGIATGLLHKGKRQERRNKVIFFFFFLFATVTGLVIDCITLVPGNLCEWKPKFQVYTVWIAQDPSLLASGRQHLRTLGVDSWPFNATFWL